MELKIRELRGDDVFPLLTILGLINITDEFAELMGGKDGMSLPSLPKAPIEIIAKHASGDVLSKVEQKQFNEYQDKLKEVEQEREVITAQNGIRVMGSVMKKVLVNAHLAKDEINAFLGNLTDRTGKQIGELRINEYTTLLMSLFKKPEIKDVFTSAASLMGSMEGDTNSETSSTEDTPTH